MTNTTASIDLEQLDKLEALAHAATPGPWNAQTVPGFGGRLFDVRQGPSVGVAGSVHNWENASLIAAANPTTLLPLIALARRSLTSGAPAEQSNSVEFDGIKTDAAGPSAEHARWVLKQIADLNPESGSIGTAVFMAREGLAGAAAKAEQAPKLWRWKWVDSRGINNPWRYSETEPNLNGEAVVESFVPATAAGAGNAQAATTASASGPKLFDTYWTMKAIEYKGRPFTSRREAAQEAWSAALARAPLPAPIAQPVDDARDAAIKNVIDHIADNWPMKKYSLKEIEDRLRAELGGRANDSAAEGESQK